jgi:hypothetical protein
MAKKVENVRIERKRIRRPGQHKKNVNKRNKVKTFFG